MLPARYRMTRSTEFSTTVSKGVRSAQPDLVVHMANDADDPTGPRIGLVVSKAVGNAVVRHRVSRRLRHSVYPMLDQLQPGHRLVIRALPGAGAASSARLTHELSEALRRARPRVGASA
ncbi:ribonuclease P protein component [Mycolicibacterium litorale]|uniref:Ribonuclease P protein component n=1 Tax=Mycolicibacterium litorale TaxID=758802 RepID=A0AAD1IPA3_9MYCO|nr:ribonuclease P protein component [Mycolicibacterium litorale]MCV7417367.1 ribonuclease P protein component [Mycolicibacterium litorale]TDY05156.1 ribonuclease P protein component [Mycolicibacterium litorale]BBY18591.1 ribonuclease P protein component [Mycolicibacterium litorale]